MNNFTLPRTRLLLLLILLTALAVGGLAFGLRQSQAQSAQPTVAAPAIYAEARVNVGSLNLRTGPHVSYTAVAYLMDGERVRLVGRNRAGTWAQIELYNGYRGWVNARYLQPGIDIVALPVADVSLLGITAFVTNDPIPVYAGPGTLYRRVGTARPGETLALNGRNDAASWVHVYLPDASGAAADPLPVGIQLSEFLATQERFLCLGFGRRRVLSPGMASSVIIGFRVDAELRHTIRFLDDPSIPHDIIHETCERCPLTPEQCLVRAAPPAILEARRDQMARKLALSQLQARHAAAD